MNVLTADVIYGLDAHSRFFTFGRPRVARFPYNRWLIGLWDLNDKMTNKGYYYGRPN